MNDLSEVVQDGYVAEAPSQRAMADLFDGWTSVLPLDGATGAAPLFNDSRVTWAIDAIGGVADKAVLELGPLEGGHTYMLHGAGAKTITAIEANRRLFLRCLVTKEMFGLSRASVQLGNFVPYLRARNEPVDVIWAAGVLYHMTEPLNLIRDIGRLANATHIWTHYVPDGEVDRDAPWAQPVTGVQVRNGVEHFVRSYFDQGTKPTYCGGVYHESSWLRRADILRAIEDTGFRNISTSFEMPDHPHGPCFAIAATK